MYTFYGDYPKHDLVLTIAACLSLIHDKEVSVVSDCDKNYRYFDGDVAGVTIGSTRDADIVLYDCHNAILGPDSNKIFTCTDFTKHAVDTIKSVHSRLPVSATFLCEQDSSLSEDYIKTFIGDSKLYSYEDDTERRIGCVYEGRLRFKKLGDSFLRTVGNFLVDMEEITQPDVKELWKLMKRGDR